MRARRFVAAACLAGLAACGGGGGSRDVGDRDDLPPLPPTVDWIARRTVIESPAPYGSRQFGGAVTWIDWDEDGLADVFVGAPGERVGIFDGAGALYLYRQTASGGFALVRRFTALDFPGGTPATGASLGAYLYGGDLDGDGSTDLAVGAPGDPVDGVTGAGRVYVLLHTPGHDALPLPPIADPSGPEEDAAFGAVLVVGGFDEDPVDDLAVGAPGATVGGLAGAGHVVVFLGTSSRPFASVVLGPLVSSSPSEGAGFGGAGATDDLDGDGFYDLILAAPGAAGGGGGRVEIFRLGQHPAFFPYATLTAPLLGSTRDSQFGAALVTADLDGDGDMDLLVGAPAGDHPLVPRAGYVALLRNDHPAFGVLTPAGRLSDAVPRAGAAFGALLAVGEVTADDADDVVVGVPGGDLRRRAGAGYLAVFPGDGEGGFGAPGILTALAPRESAAYGAWVEVTDADGDGLGDLLVGAPGPDDPPGLPGSVEVLLSTRVVPAAR